MYRSPFNIVFRGERGEKVSLVNRALEEIIPKLNIQGAFFLTFLSKVVDSLTIVGIFYRFYVFFFLIFLIQSLHKCTQLGRKHNKFSQSSLAHAVQHIQPRFHAAQ